LKREDSERESLEQELLVIGADTIVASDGKILGKPKDEKEAFLMLSGLQGKWHQVYTGVCVEVLEKEGERRKICFAERTDVKVSDMDAEEIRNYIATKEPMDKAGSYAIQGRFGRYVERIEGDYYNVVGFPLSRFFRELKEIGILL
jgi:septum formation protein